MSGLPSVRNGARLGLLRLGLGLRAGVSKSCVGLCTKVLQRVRLPGATLWTGVKIHAVERGAVRLVRVRQGQARVRVLEALSCVQAITAALCSTPIY